MKAGYARVSTKDQTVDLQVDALKKAGCTKVYTEVMNGSRAERPILSKVLEHLRAGDVLVIWKLDRLGRSLKHLIEVVNELRGCLKSPANAKFTERGIGFIPALRKLK
jgi:DNA invertase Pin-like site-specific DNA recombinase